MKSFEDGSATEGVTFINTTIDHNTNNVAAQKTGAVWSACENIQRQLPKGNRAAMRRDLMVWVRDCNESAEEFDEVMELGPRPEKIPEADEDCGDTFEEEEQYTEKEMAVAKASVNVMKCCKNVLGLALKACECVGENIDEALHQANQEKTDSNDEDTVPIQTKKRKTEILQWISNLHELARAVGEGVTDFGISLYPPLDLSDAGYEQSENKAPNDDELAIPQLGSSHLEVRIQHQLRALADCVMHVHNARLAESGKSIESCMSEEVQELAEKMKKAIIVRGNEVANAVSSYKCR